MPVLDSLLAGADERDLTKLAEYRAIGGYQGVEKARAMTPDDLITELQEANLRGRGGAGFPMGRKASLIDRSSGKPAYLVVNADESEPGAFKDREVMTRVPHRLHRGLPHRGARDRGRPRLHLHPRRVPHRVRDPPGRRRRGPEGGRLRLLRHPRPPRRRRVHLRRGDGAARLAGGAPRPAAPAAAVPAGAGPLRRADADQQRLHDRHGADHHGAGRCRVREDRLGVVAGHGHLLDLGQHRAAGQLRARARHADAGARVRHRRRRPGRPPAEVHHPRRLVRARAHARPARHAARLRLDPGRGLVLRRRVAHRRRRPLLHGAARAAGGEVLHARVVRQVHAVPRGNALDGAAAGRRSRRGTRRWPTSTSWSRSAPASSAARSARSATSPSTRCRASCGSSRTSSARTSSAAAARSATPRRSTGSSRRPTCTRITRKKPCMPDLVKLTVDDREIQVPAGTGLVETAAAAGIEIPVFCYEPRLGAPVGACRMCLVEIEGIPKPQAGCTLTAQDGMVVKTAKTSELAAAAQNSTLEFILVNHPLDCPVCDKGGECPLQDLTFRYGPGSTRMTFDKRTFEKPIPISPTIALDRERCILCYRCTRFSEDVAEDGQLIARDRGALSQIATYEDLPYRAPFSGNVIELCPVGRPDLDALPLRGPSLGDRQRADRLRSLPRRLQRQRHVPRGPRAPGVEPQPPGDRPGLDLRQGPLHVSGAARSGPRDGARDPRPGDVAVRGGELGRRARRARAAGQGGRRLGRARTLRLGDGGDRLGALAARAQGLRLASRRAARGDEHGARSLPRAAVGDRGRRARRRHRRRPRGGARADRRPLDPRGAAERRRGADVRSRRQRPAPARRRRRGRRGARRQAEGRSASGSTSRARRAHLVGPGRPRRRRARAARGSAGTRRQARQRRVLPARHAERARRRRRLGGRGRGRAEQRRNASACCSSRARRRSPIRASGRLRSAATPSPP